MSNRVLPDRPRRRPSRRSTALAGVVVAGGLALASGAAAELTIDQIGGDVRGGPFVALSDAGDRVATGSPGADDGASVGIVRVFSRNGSSWSQLGADLLGEEPGDQFGFAVELSADGNRVAAGAWRNSGTSGTPEGGHVRVFAWDGSSWSQLGNDIDGDAGSYYAGNDVALSADGSRVAVAGWTQVRVFDFDGTDWVQAGGYLSGGERGIAMSADGRRVAVGPGGGYGDVIVYDWNGSEWLQVGGSLRETIGLGDFGGCVEMSDDGTRVTVCGGDSSWDPVTLTFQWDGSDWLPVGGEIPRLVSAISGDGLRLASNDPVGIYEWDGTSWGDPTDVPQSVRYAALSADGAVVAAGIGGAVSRVFEVAAPPPASTTTQVPSTTAPPTTQPSGTLPPTGGTSGSGGLLLVAVAAIATGGALTLVRRRGGTRPSEC